MLSIGPPVASSTTMCHAPAIFTGSPYAFRPRPAEGAIEWEELPSLADTLATRLVSRGLRHDGSSGSGQPWDATLPAALDALPPPNPFREPLFGCAVREVADHDVFRHFFGS